MTDTFQHHRLSTGPTESVVPTTNAVHCIGVPKNVHSSHDVFTDCNFFFSMLIVFSNDHDIPMNGMVMSYDSHTNNAMVVGFQCDEKWMYSVSENKTINIWDFKFSQRCQREYKIRAAVNTAVFLSKSGPYCTHQDISPEYAITLLGVVPGILGVALSGYLLKLTHSWYRRIVSIREQ
ncbi:hypothetical protein CTI12_AA600640 [Artemisia annua]|uniref:Target of rapamycin complex subunit LST8 n=1 Tax=Artemisia annua TaxID=35608 RepID=A0A2U1KI20_ARTAN|nr:hypothetical protein CTI12_AA600640 [Artemisia annua]